MRPQRLSGGRNEELSVGGRTSLGGVVDEAAAVFDEEIHTRGPDLYRRARLSGLPSTQTIVDHIRDDVHAAVDIAANLVGAVAGAFDMVVARRVFRSPKVLAPARRSRSTRQ